LILAESLELPSIRQDIASVFAVAKKNITETRLDPDGDPYSRWAGPARQFCRAFQTICGNEPAYTVSIDIKSLIREATYSITNKSVFAKPPQNETDVHDRVEAVLRCVFPSLQRKPRLGKPIKNFEPDTGLPSIGTLVEFKFISRVEQVSGIADEILADTRGYTSKDWTSFVYAIYETKRFRSESEWNQLLRDCKVTEAAHVVVMSGEPRVDEPNKRASRKSDKSRRPK
jgi:hypothetical protein